VRQVAAAVVDQLRGTSVAPPPEGTFILVRREVDPADLIQLADGGLAGAVSVAGGASSHAAIRARGRALPIVARAGATRVGPAAVGLLRTEIPFTGASGWPSQADHLARLTPVLGLLAGRPAVVRLLDFSGDKIPPFLADQEPGLAALLGAPEALRDQLRAIL